jgi:uncharacterized protein
MIRVSALSIYPVKGLRGLSLKTSLVDRVGLQADRRWLVVDKEGMFQTQRRFSKMAQIEVVLTKNGIELSHPEGGSVFVEVPGNDQAKVSVQIWRDQVSAISTQGANSFLSNVLGDELSLVYLSDPNARPVDQKYGQLEDYVSFADGYPILVTTTSSLVELERNSGITFDMRRFRPNLVLSGTDPWEEDQWRVVQIGAVTFRIAKPCSRCVVTTLNPDSGEKAGINEPLSTLWRIHRAKDGGIIFGQNLIPNESGRIAVGDPVKILETGSSNLL